MVWSVTPADLIVETVARFPGCCLDDLVRLCPELTWNQIFCEVDRLSRAGHVRLMLIGPGRYLLALPTEGESRTGQSSEAPAQPPAPTQFRHDTACTRCGGLMVSERDDDLTGWRCLLCGDRIDPVILAQRWQSESAGLRTVHAGR